MENDYEEGRYLDYDNYRGDYVVPTTDFLSVEFPEFVCETIDRQIPRIADGLLFSQRKCVFGMTFSPSEELLKVSIQAAKAGEITMYPHAEKSMEGTIVTLAETPPGLNRHCVPLIMGEGNFGTLLDGERAASRYIMACLYGRPAPDQQIITVEQSYVADT